MHRGSANSVDAWLWCCARFLLRSCDLRGAPSTKRSPLPGVPGEMAQRDIKPVVVEEEQTGWGMSYDGVTATTDGVTASV